jgi:hypothetical protein
MNPDRLSIMKLTNFWLGILLLGFVLSFSSCTTEKIADYQPTGAAPSEQTVREAGVVIAVDPFSQPGRTEQYFDLNAVANGIAIIHVRINNETTDQTFLVQKKHFQLVPTSADATVVEESTNLASSKAGQNMLTTATVLYGVGSEVIGVGFLLAGAATLSHSSEVQRNFAEKELPDQTLSPGQSMDGFVYFSPVRYGEDWSRNMNVKIDLQNTRTQQDAELSVALSH